MPCRVGITTDPATRKAYWENRVVGFRKWRILEKFSSRKKAQEYEDRYAKRHNYRAKGGGPDVPGTWSVYRFEYTRDPGP